MKKLMPALLLFGVVSVAAAAAAIEVITLATAYQDGWEVELYNSGAQCSGGQLGGAKFPEGERHRYVRGCWSPGDSDSAITIKFVDGSRMTLTRRQLVPRARSGPML